MNKVAKQSRRQDSGVTSLITQDNRMCINFKQKDSREYSGTFTEDLYVKNWDSALYGCSILKSGHEQKDSEVTVAVK